MINDKYSEFVKPKKRTEVTYIPDSVVDIIIPNIGEKSNGKQRRKSTATSNDEYLLAGVSPQKLLADGKTTRSGRQITSQLKHMSLRDSPVEKFVETTEQDYEENYKVDRPENSLFDEKEDGPAIFSFRTPKRQNAIVIKACETVRTMHFTPSKESRENTPRKPWCGDSPRGREKPVNSGRELYQPRQREGTKSAKDLYDPARDSDSPNPSNLSLKTPYSQRISMKKRLMEEAAKQELDQMLEDSGSDFVPSNSDTDSDEESDSLSASDSDSERQRDSFAPMSRNYTSAKESVLTPAQQKELLAKKKSKPMKDYVFQSDEYFDRQYSKIMTSNNTLKKLKTPKFAPSKLASILKKVDRKHIEAYHSRQTVLDIAFKKWVFTFSEGYNIMLYGLGSKLHIFDRFHDKWLRGCRVVHIKGYFPDNNLKEILTSIAQTYFNMTLVPSQPHEIIEEIGKHLCSKYSPNMFLLIPNLDGKFLQAEKTQTLLSQLARLPKVHLLASIDHINSPLLWDQSKLSAYNFVWEDATTFMPYTGETSFEGSLMVQWSGGVAVSSLKSVFTSLNINSRKVFKILLEHHLENYGPKYPGMHFSDLYRECRAGFVVSSDLALRTLITEFIDHQFLKWKKDTDHLLITVDNSVLKQFRTEIDALD